MKVFSKSLVSLAAAGLLSAASAHAAPVFKPADNESGWKQQAQHVGQHKDRMQVKEETAQWRKTHVGPGTNCMDGEKYCRDNHSAGMMKNHQPMAERPGQTSADTYIGP